MEIKRLEDLTESERALVFAAIAIRENAYAPYSQFKVGAALMTEGRKDRFVGCNVENASYTGSHAETGALADMIRQISAVPHPCVQTIAVALEVLGNLHAVPCGDCRQRIREFGNDATIVFGARLDEDGCVRDVECFTLGELLPYSFGPENLGR